MQAVKLPVSQLYSLWTKEMREPGLPFPGLNGTPSFRAQEHAWWVELPSAKETLKHWPLTS